MAASTLEQLCGLAEDGEAGTLLGGVAFGVGLLVVAYKAGRRICKWRKTRVAPLGVSASAIPPGPGHGAAYTGTGSASHCGTVTGERLVPHGA
jgi:hypothetical protein